ncbi:hypothetical protein B0T10DRAFT_464478 [Thelonectria olida]|uniref:Uncharacterized protein n=1 Tax=Thelonectria olida TaxID=1576542 RepID=A0A9P8VVB9_9HYPO|nr:hypothetical protein B0T10DRAFT_464478 [Thelonectria olida]
MSRPERSRPIPDLEAGIGPPRDPDQPATNTGTSPNERELSSTPQSFAGFNIAALPRRNQARSDSNYTISTLPQLELGQRSSIDTMESRSVHTILISLTNATGGTRKSLGVATAAANKYLSELGKPGLNHGTGIDLGGGIRSVNMTHLQATVLVEFHNRCNAVKAAINKLESSGMAATKILWEKVEEDLEAGDFGSAQKSLHKMRDAPHGASDREQEYLEALKQVSLAL